MSLAGAGRSPHNYCRQAISADRRTHPPQSKTIVLRKPGVKGRCPLRVQGGARIIIAARQSPPTGAPEPHHKQNDSFAQTRGQGTMSLAGAGQSPHNHCCQAIPAVRRKPNPTKQNVSFALFIAARQSPPTGANRTPQNKTSVFRNPGSRDDVPCGCRAEPA